MLLKLPDRLPVTMDPPEDYSKDDKEKAAVSFTFSSTLVLVDLCFQMYGTKERSSQEGINAKFAKKG